MLGNTIEIGIELYRNVLPLFPTSGRIPLLPFYLRVRLGLVRNRVGRGFSGGYGSSPLTAAFQGCLH